MPEEHTAADEHAIIQQVTEPLERLDYHPLTDVASPEFPMALRGYDRAAVDAYVARVSQLVAELEATHVPEAAVHRALEKVGEETSGILKRAHETAHELAARSRAEAEERLETARAEAERIVGAARAGLRSLDEDTDRVWAERTKLLEDTKRLADEMLSVAERGLERFPPDEAAAETVVERDDPTQIMTTPFPDDDEDEPVEIRRSTPSDEPPPATDPE
jgi:cell division initiation protein